MMDYAKEILNGNLLAGSRLIRLCKRNSQRQPAGRIPVDPIA
jgi:hypothetical protein